MYISLWVRKAVTYPSDSLSHHFILGCILNSMICFIISAKVDRPVVVVPEEATVYICISLTWFNLLSQKDIEENKNYFLHKHENKKQIHNALRKWNLTKLRVRVFQAKVLRNKMWIFMRTSFVGDREIPELSSFVINEHIFFLSCS